MFLNDEQIKDYHQNGFISVKGLFTQDEISTMRCAYDSIWERAQEIAAGITVDDRLVHDEQGARFTYQKKTLRFVAWCGYAHPTFKQFGADQRLLEIASQILETRRLEQLINQIHFKMPNDGQAFAWHKDSQHRGMGNGRFVDVNGLGSYVQSAIAIDDVTAENGPLGLIPASHKSGHVEHSASKDGYTVPAHSFDASTAVYPTPAAGDVLFFNPYTIHGSTPNRSTKPRRIFINGFAIPGANKGQQGLMHQLGAAACVS